MEIFDIGDTVLVVSAVFSFNRKDFIMNVAKGHYRFYNLRYLGADMAMSEDCLRITRMVLTEKTWK